MLLTNIFTDLFHYFLHEAYMKYEFECLAVQFTLTDWTDYA